MGVLSEYLARKDRDSNAAAVRGLMSVYNTGNQGHSVTPQQQGLMDQGQLPPQFYQRAGTIPGYEQLLGQAQSGQQAMNRQTQEQQWSAENMTAAQAEQVRQRQEQMAQQQAQWAGVSGNQQAVIDANAQRNAAEAGALDAIPAFLQQGGKVPTDYQLNADGSGIEVIPQSKTDVVQRAEIAQYQQALEVIDDQLQFLGQYGDYESGGEAKKLDARARQILIPAMSKIYGSGVLNEGERDAYMQELHQFNSLSSIPGMENAALAKMEALRQMMQRKLEDTMAAQGRQIPGPP